MTAKSPVAYKKTARIAVEFPAIRVSTFSIAWIPFPGYPLGLIPPPETPPTPAPTPPPVSNVIDWDWGLVTDLYTASMDWGSITDLAVAPNQDFGSIETT